MNILIVSLGTPGFIYPSMGLALKLEEKEHTVLFATDSLFHNLLSKHGVENVYGQDKAYRINAWGDLLTQRRQILHLESIIESNPVDVIVTHVLSLGAVYVSRKHNIPIAVTGLSAYIWPTTEPCPEIISEPEARNRQWNYDDMMRIYNRLLTSFQLPTCAPDYEESPILGDLFLVQSVPEFEPYLHLLPRKIHCVGNCQWEPHVDDFEVDTWIEDSRDLDMPIIYVQIGRAFEKESFWPHLTDVFGGQSVRIAGSAGRSDDDELDIPENFFVRDHVPQERVLRHARAVISNGHTTSVLGALSHGLPMLLFPNGSGTYEIALRCRSAGVAIGLSTKKINAGVVEASFHKIMDDEFKANANYFQTLYSRFNGRDYAAGLIEELANTRKAVLRNY